MTAPAWAPRLSLACRASGWRRHWSRRAAHRNRRRRPARSGARDRRAVDGVPMLPPRVSRAGRSRRIASCHRPERASAALADRACSRVGERELLRCAPGSARSGEDRPALASAASRPLPERLVLAIGSLTVRTELRGLEHADGRWQTIEIATIGRLDRPLTLTVTIRLTDRGMSGMRKMHLSRCASTVGGQPSAGADGHGAQTAAGARQPDCASRQAPCGQGWNGRRAHGWKRARESRQPRGSADRARPSVWPDWSARMTARCRWPRMRFATAAS